MFARWFIKQILSGRLPWSEIKSEKPELRILMMIAEGRGPQRPGGHPEIGNSGWDIIQRCLLPRPEHRPSADEVLNLVKSTMLLYDASRSVDNSSPVCARTRPPNFVIFGEMGVGKSSLVNLIAADQIAAPSSCIIGYPITFSDSRLDVNLFDTVSRGNDFRCVGVLIQKQSRLAWTATL
jgi:serine/threonine protein kinase